MDEEEQQYSDEKDARDLDNALRYREHELENERYY